MKNLRMRRRQFLKGAAVLGVSSGILGSPYVISRAGANEPVRVGVLLSLTGAWTAYGLAQLWGLELAADEINAAGGILGRKVELVVADTKTQPRIVTEQANRLIRQENVMLLAGTTSSADRNAAAPVVTSQDKILLYPTYYEGQEKEYYPGVCNKNIFMFGPEPTQQVWPFLEKMLGMAGKKVFMIGNDYAWPRVSNAVTKIKLGELGGEVVGEVYIPFGTPNYDSALREIRASKAELLFLTLTGSDTINFRRQYAASGLKDSTLLWSIDDEEIITSGLGPEVAKGDYASFDYFMGLDNPNNKAFLEKFHAKYGSDKLMNTIGACQYNSLRMAAIAMENNKEVSTEALRSGLRGLTFDGAPQGTTTMRAEDHQAVLPSYLAKVRDGWKTPGEMFEIVVALEAVKPVPARCDLPL